MSLVVWLPLDGDLRNLGCSDIEVTNNGATINNNGKIGKCYYFDGNAHWLQLSKSVGNLYSGDFSWAVWLKPTDSTRSIISSEFSSSGSSNVAFELSASRGVRIYWNGSPDIYPSNSTLPQDTWTHVAITKTTGIIKTYINGELKHTYTGTLSDRTSTSYIRIGDDYRGGTSVSYMGYMNDWRLYNHCLSAAEVKEIAQGLVLHYKLDGINNSSFLPTQYQQLEYIESSGTSYFDTGYKFDAEIDECKVIFKGNDTSNNGMIFASSGSKYFWFYYYSSNGIRIYASNGSGQQGITGISSDLNQHTMEFKNKTYYIDGVNKGSLSNSYTETTNNIWLFSYGSNNYPFKGRIYYVEIIKNKIKQRVFIPAKRLTDSAIGMYDLITKNFYTSSNTAFTAGAAIGTLTIQDSSGYGHNGTITGTLTTSSDSPRYDNCSNFNGTERITTSTLGADIRTLSCWCKTTKNKSTSQHMIADSFSQMCISFYNGTIIGVFGTTRGTGSKCTLGSSYKENDWNHIVVVKTDDAGARDIYCNGVKLTPTSNDYWSAATGFFVGARNTSNGNAFYGQISDVRAYVTPLLDKDIKLLYNISMRVNNSQGVHSFEFDENQPNLMWRPENARAAGLGINWAEGLGAYTQSNCQVTCDKNGYRIYRPPNLTVSSNGNTMWGGLKVRNSTNNTIHTYNASTDNIFGLIKGHTYIFIITVEGKSSNNFSSYGITNNMGWDGHGLSPNPSNVTYKLIGTNFNGKTECYYKFTISDDIVKTCTSTYSSFTNGNQYLSYMDFMFGFGYESTGSLGTDLYISNIRLFDLTNKTSKNIQKSGIIEFTQFIEKEENITKIRNDEELYAIEFIEI